MCRADWKKDDLYGAPLVGPRKSAFWSQTSLLGVQIPPVSALVNVLPVLPAYHTEATVAITRAKANPNPSIVEEGSC